ncbi:Variable membrane protein A [Candidatus Phytoplasma rubi]|uniref:Variable membrane protein A n=3 Tax=16SrV (Elm yellows group) TaxID=85625 RepID=A0ABY7BT11_9MOLU|nr:lipoprotein 17-related variable surface protein [Candidatus Phytoplasma rubi]WAN63604.1 Variable membrane protein A [Candidatus Phytoplasma rubi]
MIEKQMNRKINIQSFISLIFVFMFLFLNVFYLTQIKAIDNLSDVLSTKELGLILIEGTTITKEEIISQIKEKNNNLKNQNLQIVGEPTKTNAKVKSNDFQGEVEVAFTVKKKEVSKVELSTFLKNKDLGEIKSKDLKVIKEEIISQIKEKNSDLKNQNLQIVGEPTETKATVKSDDFQGEAEVTFTVKKKEVSKVELSTFLKTKDLGEITSKDLKATKEEIISKIKEKNNNLKNQNLQILGEPTENKATVKSDDFQGEAKVTFTVKQKEVSKVELSTFLKNKDLGEIKSKDLKVTKEEIISQIKEKNSDLKNQNLQIVGEPTETKATVKSDDFQGEAEVTFTVKKKEVSKVELSTFLKTKDLGEITSKDLKATKEEIISKIKEKNNNLKNKNLQIVGEPTETKATVKSDDFQGELEVEFTVKKKSFFSLFTIAIILSIGVASLALLGYYFYEKNNKKID